ncbi:aspartate--tRNA(Asn) ligase [Candidatus Kaiserbacteria bacterium CG10_big_fil_rev_8_21_14_0_10_56_12]|uniref:Aspartate--tRNA ligase n=1 Tax=Candidatus Kaiserbacteria bacterium CG10_big_fil_rev_8_21_14_0_10_56_12 TaxID=1974611 RepID=A0A2H0UCJ0_9BACT|nr:MAG: aspartate--tRNA(Asn) ligase [Candidatus Kaiserbacteria bacterium CG10_big_fil_rev_8_21_14_0_10_56_12]
MERTLIGDLNTKVGETVTIEGWVDVRRDQGKMVFFDFRDRSSKVQGVVLPGSDAIEAAKDVKVEYVLRVVGVVNKRPEKNVQVDKQNGDIELEITQIEVLAEAETLPFPKDEEVNLDTLLDNRPLTLRSQRGRDIFAVQASIVDAYRASLKQQDFTDFQAPALVGGDAEGGAAVFKVDYFYDQTAYLATSPQLYKQIMVGAFERVYTIARIFRAEKSATTRHLSELTQMDFEMGFITDESDVMRALEIAIRDTVTSVAELHSDVFSRFGVAVPKLGKQFPVLTLAEAHQTLGVPPEDDMTPEHERAICEWALREHDSDFVFITRFPTAARAFYTMSADETVSRGFDLLFRGLEINSGAQRIHKYDEMVARIKERGMDPEKFGFYLQAFKYGMPPHGGCSTGLERFTMKMLGLANVKEATLFPRDINRIDVLLSRAEGSD